MCNNWSPKITEGTVTRIQVGCSEQSKFLSATGILSSHTTTSCLSLCKKLATYPPTRTTRNTIRILLSPSRTSYTIHRPKFHRQPKLLRNKHRLRLLAYKEIPVWYPMSSSGTAFGLCRGRLESPLRAGCTCTMSRSTFSRILVRPSGFSYLRIRPGVEWDLGGKETMTCLRGNP